MKAEERQQLFNYMSNEHGLHLLENELDEIERILGDKREYIFTKCDCMPHETTGSMTEEVCNNCGRVQK